MKELTLAFLKSGVASILSTIFGIVSTKIFAVTLGPSGIGVYSLLKQILFFAMTLGTLGGQTALIQGLSSKTGSNKAEYMRSAFQIFVICTFVVLILLTLLPDKIAIYSFGQSWADKVNLVRWLVLPIAITVLSIFLTSVLNSYKAISSLALGQMVAAISGALLAYPVATYISNNGSIAFAWYMAANSAVAISLYGIVAYRNGWLNSLRCSALTQINIGAIRYFIGFASVSLITNLVACGGLLFIKVLIAKNGGLAAAGLFDVSWTISMIYLSLILNSFSTYYLPRLSEVGSHEDRCQIINDVMRLCIIIMAPIIVVLVVSKSVVVELGYSERFKDSIKMMQWMFIGDYFKVTSWVLSVSALAKAEMKVLFWTEILWWSFFVASVAIISSNKFDMQYIGLSYMLLYSAYLLYFYLRSVRQGELDGSSRVIISWLAGLIVIVLSSFFTWNQPGFNFIISFMAISSALVVSLAVMKSSERMYVKSVIKRMFRYE